LELLPEEEKKDEEIKDEGDGTINF